MNYSVIDTSTALSVSQRFGCCELLGKIVSANHYNDADLSSFFAPASLIDCNEEVYEKTAFLLKNIKEKGQKVFIFGDYDCDGICATTMVCMLMTKLQIPYGFYIPNRASEGYGLNMNILQQAYEKGYEVLFTVDNGVSAQQALKWAKEHNMCVIVSDHHRISEDVECDVLIHPSTLRQDKQFLCGTTVVYLLCRYLKMDDEKMSVLAMLATISDVMELRGINIPIVRNGLKLLNSHCYAQVEEMDSFFGSINEEDIGFKIVPKINAIGRMEGAAQACRMHCYDVVRYLMGDKKYLPMIFEINELRKKMSSLAISTIAPQIDTARKIQILFDEDVHVGLIGAVASRLSAQYNCIVFVFTHCEGLIKGSGRSIDAVDIMALLDDFKENTIALGGHCGACGITLNEQQFEQFKAYMALKESQIPSTAEVECIEISEQQLTTDALKEVFSFRPYGQGRKLPMVHVCIEKPDEFAIMKNAHQLKWNHRGVEFISFDNEGYDAYVGKPLNCIGELYENRYFSKVSYGVRIRYFI